MFSMMCYAVGILPNICVCDLTSELAGHHHKYYAIPLRESPIIQTSLNKHFFNHATFNCSFSTRLSSLGCV